jgi:predicted XRE-type DNA-binding protein
VDHAKVLALLRGRLSGFSIDRLVRYAAALDQEVELVVQPRIAAAGLVG